MCNCPAHRELVDCTCNCDHTTDRMQQWKSRALKAERDAVITAVLLVKAAGGRVAVPERLALETSVGEELANWVDETTGDFMYAVRRSGGMNPNPGSVKEPSEHAGGNAEDCPACDTSTMPYPWICPETKTPRGDQHSWLDQLANASLKAARDKFGPEQFPESTSTGTDS